MLGVKLSRTHTKCEMPVDCPGRGFMEKLDVGVSPEFKYSLSLRVYIWGGTLGCSFEVTLECYQCMGGMKNPKEKTLYYPALKNQVEEVYSSEGLPSTKKASYSLRSSLRTLTEDSKTKHETDQRRLYSVTVTTWNGGNIHSPRMNGPRNLINATPSI